MSGLPIDLALDDEGHPRAFWTLSGPAETVLPDFLETDLGLDRVYGHRLAAEARRAIRRRSHGWHVSGNAYAVAIGPEMTVIERLDARPDARSVSVPTLDFLSLVERWLAVASQHGRRPGPESDDG